MDSFDIACFAWGGRIISNGLAAEYPEVVSDEAATTETELDPERAAAMLEGGELELIDVRRDYEWDAGRIPGARHVEVNELAAAVDSIPRDRPVVFYCRSGSRSGMAADAFRQAGFDSYNLAGGITAWVERGLPLTPEGGIVADPQPT
jgi:rhodanese-related sulfurtransferase